MSAAFLSAWWGREFGGGAGFLLCQVLGVEIEDGLDNLLQGRRGVVVRRKPEGFCLDRLYTKPRGLVTLLYV